MTSYISEMTSRMHSNIFLFVCLFVWFSSGVKCWDILQFEHKTVEVSHAWKNCLHSHNAVEIAGCDQAIWPSENVILTCLPVQRECLNAFSVINLFYLWARSLRPFLTLYFFLSHYVSDFYLRANVIFLYFLITFSLFYQTQPTLGICMWSQQTTLKVLTQYPSIGQGPQIVHN